MSNKTKTSNSKREFLKKEKYTKERCASGISPNCKGYVEQGNTTSVCNECNEHYGTNI